MFSGLDVCFARRGSGSGRPRGPGWGCSRRAYDIRLLRREKLDKDLP